MVRAPEQPSEKLPDLRKALPPQDLPKPDIMEARAPVPKEREPDQREMMAEFEAYVNKDKEPENRRQFVYSFISAQDRNRAKEFSEHFDFIKGSEDHPNNKNLKLSDVAVIAVATVKIMGPKESALAAFDRNGKLIGYAD